MVLSQGLELYNTHPDVDSVFYTKSKYIIENSVKYSDTTCFIRYFSYILIL